MDNEKIYTESYFGKTKNLLQCESVIDDIISELKKNPCSAITKSQLNKKLESLIEEQFGFKKVCISWSIISPSDILYTEPSKNIFRETSTSSISNTLILFDPTYIVNDNIADMGYYDKNHKNVLWVQISTNSVLHDNLTSDELLAIILHEIGHNFDKTPYAYISKLSNIYFSICGMLNNKYNLKILMDNGFNDIEDIKNALNNLRTSISLSVGGTNTVRRIMSILDNTWDNLTTKIPFMKKIEFLGVQATRIYYASVKFINFFSLGQMVKKSFERTSDNAVTWLFRVVSRKKEKYADSFAAAYGYASSLTSALYKINDDIHAPFEDMKIFRFMKDIIMTMIMIENAILCPDHGTAAERARTNIKFLKKDLNEMKDLHPEVRERLAQDITDCETLMKNWENKKSDEKLVISTLFEKIIVNTFGNDAFLIEKIFPDYHA